MLITITLSQLILMISIAIIIVVIIYMLQTLRNIRQAVTDAAGILSQNDEQISNIILHIEHITANTDEISRLLAGKHGIPAAVPPRLSLSESFRELKTAFRRKTGPAETSLRLIRKFCR